MGGNKRCSCMGTEPDVEPNIARPYTKCAFVTRMQQDGQCTCNITLWRVLATIVALQRNMYYNPLGYSVGRHVFFSRNLSGLSGWR